jgi:hypothetical protein
MGAAMRARAFAFGMGIAAVLLAGLLGLVGRASAQSDEEISALNRQVIALLKAAKYPRPCPWPSVPSS